MSKISSNKKRSHHQAFNSNDCNEEFSINWDIDKYRRDYESDEHWKLRKRFMEAHKQRFPEDKLVCLAQVFTNMEFMGCKYPSETMKLVAELSKDVAKQFRMEHSNRLKRTFVSASDAAESRAKGYKSIEMRNSTKTNSIPTKCSEINISHNVNNDIKVQAVETRTDIDLLEGLKFGKFILNLCGERSCIRLSAQRSNSIYNEKDMIDVSTSRKAVEIYIDDHLIARACEDNVKNTKAQAFHQALELLQKHCYTIKLNPHREMIKVQKINNKIECDIIGNSRNMESDKKLDASNKGYKMLKMMGWSGGGLGAQQQGRENPLSYLTQINRIGLGNKINAIAQKYFSEAIKHYANSDDIRELKFENTFSREERVLLHKIAGSFNLKSVSRGDVNQRYLTVSKKSITDLQILQKVLIEKHPMYTNQYLIQVPESKSSLFPAHTEKLTL